MLQLFAEKSEESTHVLLDGETVLLSPDGDEQLTIRWNPRSILPTMEPLSYTVDITLYRFERSSDNHVSFQHFLNIMRDQENNGTVTFSVPESNDPSISRDIHPVAIRISIGRALQSNSDTASLINVLGYRVEERSLGLVAQWTSTLYYHDSPSFRQLCTQWSQNQQTPGETIVERLPPCPRRVDQARAPNSGLTEDRGYWIQKANRFFHPRAATCFRQSTFTRSVSYIASYWNYSFYRRLLPF